MPPDKSTLSFLYKGSFRGMGGNANWSSHWERLIGCSTAPNYHVGGVRVGRELCGLSESSVQIDFSDKAGHLCSVTLSRQTQAETGKPH